MQGAESYLLKENTLNYSKPVCWNARPCRRVGYCGYCLNRQKAFIKRQFLESASRERWTHHLTVSFLRFQGSKTEALTFLGGIRAKLHRELFSKNSIKFISFAAVGVEGGTFGFTPHFHTVCSFDIRTSQLKENTKAILGRLVTSIPNAVHIRGVINAERSLKTLANYLLNTNYEPALKFRPKRFRLITASREIRTGHPTASTAFKKVPNGP